MLLKFNNGPSASDQHKLATMNAVRSTMLTIVKDTPLLLEVVAGGPQHFRSTFLKTHRGLAVDGHVADMLFAFFSDQVVARFGQHRPAEILNALEIDVQRPPTQTEIDNAWEVESFSSDEGRRYFYGRDGHPEALIKQIQVVN